MNSRGPWAESQRPALRLVGLTALVVTLTACEPAFVVEEATVAEIHQAMAEGRLTAEALVQHYLDRIEAYDKQGPSINSLITVSLTALDRARTLDAALAAGSLTGPDWLCWHSQLDFTTRHFLQLYLHVTHAREGIKTCIVIGKIINI